MRRESKRFASVEREKGYYLVVYHMQEEPRKVKSPRDPEREEHLRRMGQERHKFYSESNALIRERYGREAERSEHFLTDSVMMSEDLGFAKKFKDLAITRGGEAYLLKAKLLA